MIKKECKLLFALILFFLLAFTSTNVYASVSTTRISGKNRYDTSANVALSGWQQSDYAVLAYGEDYPDAVSATPLAKKYDAPVLLTQKDSLPPEIINVIQKLKVKNVIIIGGTGVISVNVENQLELMGINVSRIFGQDRYATAVKIAEQLDDVKKVVVVTNDDYKAALSIAPEAAKMNMPILLITRTGVPNVVQDYMNQHTSISKTFMVDSHSFIDELLQKSFPNVCYISETPSFDISSWVFFTFDDELSDLNYNKIYAVTGENFADALSASALASKTSSPLFLIGISRNDKSNDDNNNIKDLISSTLYRNHFKKGETGNVTIIGGNGAVKDDLTIPDKKITFKDPCLDKLVRETIGKLTGDLYKSDVQNIDELNAYGLSVFERNINDLSGIENLTELEVLNIPNIFWDGVHYLDISPLEKLSGLNTLDLTGKHIISLGPLHDETNLTTLYLSANKISDLSPLKNLINLSDVCLESNNISDLSPLSGLTNIQKLNLGINKISDMRPLKNLTNLKTLYLYNNNISDLSPLKGITSLTDIALECNKISDISPLYNLTNLININLQYNKIANTDLNKLKTSLSKNRNLKNFNTDWDADWDTD
jgi:internalin A